MSQAVAKRLKLSKEFTDRLTKVRGEVERRCGKLPAGQCRAGFRSAFWRQWIAKNVMGSGS